MASFSTFLQSNPVQPTPQTTLQKVGGFINKNVLQPVGQAFNGGINNAVSSAKAIPQDIVTGNGPKAIMDTTGIAGGLGEAAMSPLAPIMNPGGITAKGIGAASDAISNIPAVQKFANSRVGQAAAGTIQTAQNVANFAGGAGMVGGALDLPSKVSDLVTDHPIFKSGGGNAVATAQANLETAGQNAATAVGDITDAGNSVQSAAGQKFAQAGQQIDEAGATATLTPDQLDRLNQLKTSGKFALPDAFSQKTNPLLDAPQTPGEIENPGKQFTGSQMQDLIHQLNNSTFTDKVSGLGVDQGKVGLTNEIKDVAQQAFGSVKDAEGNPVWQKAYSDYSRTRGALDSISDIMSTKRNPTASELQAKIGTIQKLGSTPSGKVLLQNALSDFRGVTGYDLTDPVATIHRMVDKEIALETAQKGGFVKQFARGASNPSRLGGAITRLAILYPVISAIKNAVSGK